MVSKCAGELKRAPRTRLQSSRSAVSRIGKTKSFRRAPTHSCRNLSTSRNSTPKPSVSCAYSDGVCHNCQVRRAPVAQLDRVSDYESEGQRFESSRAYHQPKFG